MQAIDINEFISSKFAIRGALGDINKGHLIQSIEDDLLRWVGEAYEKITADTKAATIYEPFETPPVYVADNRVKLPNGFKALECLTYNGQTISFLYNKSRCTSNCSNSCGTSCSCCKNPCDSAIKFYIDGCWIKFSPTAEMGAEVVINGYKTAVDEEGYPMIIDKCTTAIQKYVAWKVCMRDRDNRAAAYEQQWYFDCRQARSWINKKTDQEMRAISRWWQPQGFYLRGYLRRI